MESKVQEHVLNGQEVLASSQNREYSGTTHNEQGNDEIMPKSDDRPTKNKSGFNLDMTREISNAVKIPVIASGGVGNLDHLVDGVIKGGASAVLAASIFHFGDYTIDQAKKHMDKAGIPVRLER